MVKEQQEARCLRQMGRGEQLEGKWKRQPGQTSSASQAITRALTYFTHYTAFVKQDSIV